MPKILKLHLDSVSPVGYKILAYRALETFPEVPSVTNVAVAIEDSGFVNRDAVSNEDSFVLEISEDGSIVKISDKEFERFKNLMRARDAVLYDFCGEVPKLGSGVYTID